MARKQTAAAERTAQNHKLKQQAAIELGRDDVTRAEAESLRRRARSAEDLPADREIDLEGFDVTALGRAICKVQDMRVQRAASIVLSVVTSVEHLNAITRASLVGGDALVVEFYRVARPQADDEEEGEDA